MKIPVEMSRRMAGINQSLSTAELFTSLAAPSSHHPSRRGRDSRSISWTSRSVDQLTCLSQHALNNGLLQNPDYPRE